jgi:protein-S-isoprenylcysteine O-methyltransferase Ste14
MRAKAILLTIWDSIKAIVYYILGPLILAMIFLSVLIGLILGTIWLLPDSIEPYIGWGLGIIFGALILWFMLADIVYEYYLLIKGTYSKNLKRVRHEQEE